MAKVALYLVGAKALPLESLVEIFGREAKLGELLEMAIQPSMDLAD